MIPSPAVYVLIALLGALLLIVAIVALASFRPKAPPVAAPVTFDVGGLAEMVAGLRRQLAALEEDTQHRFKVMHGRITRYLEGPGQDQLELGEDAGPGHQAALLAALAKQIPPNPEDALEEARAGQEHRRRILRRG